MNNKGFSMMELLGVIVILGILMAVAVGGVYIYHQKAEQQGYDTIAKSSSEAIENYLMDYPDDKGSVYIKDLYEDNYIERPADPKDGTKTCDGVVIYDKTSGSGNALDSYEYTVHLCCQTYEKTYTYPDGEIKDIYRDDYCKNLDSVDKSTGDLVAAPTCTLELSGDKGTGNNFRSDVKIKLVTGGSVKKKGLDTTENSENDKTEVIYEDDGKNIKYYGYVKNGMGTGSCDVTFTKDTVKPTVTTSTVVSTSDNLSFSLADNNELAAYAITTSSDKPASSDWVSISGATYNKTVSKGSSKTYYVHVKDKAGNTNYAAQKVVSVDPPKCEIVLSGTKSEKGWYTTDVEVKLKVTGSTTSKGLATSKNSNNGKTSITHTTDATSVTYYGYVVNEAGSSSCDATFKRDATGPTVTFTNSSNGAWTNENVKITINSSDNVGLSAVQYSYNQSAWYDHDWDTGSTLEKTVGTWSAERNNTVYLKVTDVNGNATIVNTKVRIDKTKPTYTTVAPKCGDYWGNGAPHYVQISFSDTASGLGTRKVTWYDANSASSPRSVSTNFNGNSTSYTDILANSGSWLAFDHSICDVAGNCNSWADSNVTFGSC